MDSVNHPVLIAFGANLGDRQATAARALEDIRLRVGKILKTSSLIENPPLVLPGEDPENHPWFLNAVWQVETKLTAKQCLHQLLEIERLIGRVRERRWGPRVIDLDLLAHGSSVIDSSGLTIPHPEMHKRVFVLEPLVEILPDWEHPLLHQTARQLLQKLSLE